MFTQSEKNYGTRKMMGRYENKVHSDELISVRTMDLFNLIVGVLMGVIALSSKRISFSVKLALSCITAFYLLELKLGEVEIWDFDQYTPKSLRDFFRSVYFGWGVLFSIVSYVGFYVFLKWFFRFTFHPFLNKYYADRYRWTDSASDVKLRSFLTDLGKKFVSISVMRYAIKTRQETVRSNLSKSPEELEDGVYDDLSLLIHLFIGWQLVGFYEILPFWLISTMLIILTMVSIWVLPAIPYFIEIAREILLNELDRDKRDISN